MEKIKDSNRAFKITVIFAVCVIALCLSIAYAALAQQLKIKGTAEVEAASWQVEMPNEPTVNKSGNDVSVTYDKDTSETGVTLIKDLHIVVRKPGDFVELQVPIANNGDINAYLQSVSTGKGIISCTARATDPTSKLNDEKLICGTGENNLGANVIYTVHYGTQDVTDENLIGVDTNLAQGMSKTVKIRLEFLNSATQIPTDAVDIKLPDVAFMFQQAS